MMAKVTRLLSLKAGTVKQSWAVSGATFDVASNFLESVLKLRLPDTMKEEHGWKDSNFGVQITQFKQCLFEKMYAQMEKQVKDYSMNDIQEVKEYNLVKTVYDGIKWLQEAKKV